MNPVLNWGNDDEGYGGGSAAAAEGQNSRAVSGTVVGGNNASVDKEKEKGDKKSWFKRSEKSKAPPQGSTPPATPNTLVGAPAMAAYDVNGSNANNATVDVDQKKKPWYKRTTKRSQDLTLLIACAVLVLLLNVPFGRYILYPFQLLATWVHECCHAVATVMTGGTVDKLEIFKDGSGLAHVRPTSTWALGFAASAGYPGTTVFGFLLLMCRRSKWGPIAGTVGIGAGMVLTCIILVRNTFGFAVLTAEGVILALLGWFLAPFFRSMLFSFLAATCCLNAFESIRTLFGYDGTHDAKTVAEAWGGDFRMWATFWLLLSFILTIVGIWCACDCTKKDANDRKNASNNDQSGLTLTPSVSMSADGSNRV